MNEFVSRSIICESAEATFEAGREIGGKISAGDVILLFGGLGAGKTLLTKGILAATNFDVDEVTSPSFALINLYKTDNFDVYHIDLWRLSEKIDISQAVGLDEIIDLPNAVSIIEWAEKLGTVSFPNRTLRVTISGDGDNERLINIEV